MSIVMGCMALFSASTARASEPSSAYIRDWLICGPVTLPAAEAVPQDFAHLRGFGRNYFEAQGKEGGVRPKAGDTVVYPGGDMVWKTHNAPEDIIDLNTVVSTAEHVLAYAYAEFESDQEQAAVLALGSNDGCRVWLNGERIFDVPRARPLQLDDDYVPVLLKKGTNRLLLKVEERGNDWGFCARFLPLDSSDVWKKIRFFEVEKDEQGNAYLKFAAPDSLLNVFEKVHINIHNNDSTQSRFLKLGNLPSWSSYHLPPRDTDAYGEYMAKLECTFKGGKKAYYTLSYTAGTPVDYSLFANGKSDYVITLRDDATDAMHWAAEELQKAIAEISGVTLPIVDMKKKGERPAIIIGISRLLSPEQRNNFVPPPEEQEMCEYQNYGDNIFVGSFSDERGVMYAVMSFLENELGVRYYTPSVTVMPKRDSYSFRYLHFSDKPGLRVRNTFYKEAFDPIWAARNRSNGAMGTREQPGGVEGYWGVHTFYPLLSPAEFFDTHPEYSSLIDGERIHDRAQLCLTNPEVLNIITDRLREKMRALPGNLIYSVSQNDWRQPCQCENCQAIAVKEESEAGPMLWFVNQVAERVEEEFPDKLIGTLAYQYTRKPPKHIRPRDNVVIRFCSIECCFAHDFKSCPENVDFLEDLEQWSRIADKIYVWDYVVNFSNYVMPFPNFNVLQSNIQTFRDNNAIGIMEQGAYQSRGGEFAELKAYLISKLLWNPEADTEAIINDFMYGYYGRAGQHVRRYFDLCQDLVQPDTHMRIFFGADHVLYSDDFIREGEAIFAQAKKVADTPEILKRVEMAELPLLYLKCRRMPQEALRDGSYAHFMAVVGREGITHFAERDNGFVEFMEKQRELTK